MTPRCKHCGRFVSKKDSHITWDYSWNPDIEYFHKACEDWWLKRLDEIMRAENIASIGEIILQSNKEHKCHG
jgi:hypothetical protein